MMRKYKNLLFVLILLLPTWAYAYSKEILKEFEKIQNTFEIKIMTMLSVRDVSPQDIDPEICKVFNEFTEDTYQIFEKNQQYLDDKEIEQVKSRTFLQDIVQEFQKVLAEKGIHC